MLRGVVRAIASIVLGVVGIGLLPAAGAMQELPASGDLLDNWSTIVYQSRVDNNWDIYVAGPDRYAPPRQRLTTHPGQDITPRLARGAQAVVFASDRDGNFEIYRMKSDGSEQRRLTTHAAEDASPAWSPDARQIVFMSRRAGNWEIYMMGAEGGEPVRLTDDAADDRHPTWSPDGQHIAWVRGTAEQGVLWIMNANGSGARPLSSPLRALRQPVWSPDGSRLAFTFSGGESVSTGIGMMNADGSDVRVLLQNFWSTSNLEMAAWSPDGVWLLFNRLDRFSLGYEQVLQTSLWRLSAQGSRLEQVTSGLDEGAADWQTRDVDAPSTSMFALPAYSRVLNMIVSWGGADVGPAGIAAYDVQYRVGEQGPWVDLLKSTQATAVRFTGTPGTTVFFRVRARDYAFNMEPWPAATEGDTATTLFTWQLSGTVTDSRGIPLSGVAISSTPRPVRNVQTDSDGNFLMYLQTEGDLALQASHAGFGASTASNVHVVADQSINLYLPPKDTRIVNGGFEDNQGSLSHWRSAGTVPVGARAGRSHSGVGAATFGEECPFPCLEARTLDLPPQSHPSAPVFGPDGTLHFLYGIKSGHTAGSWWNINAVSRSPAGVWSTPQLIGRSDWEYHPLDIELAMDGSGTLHAIWPQRDGTSYSQRAPDGRWTTPRLLDSARDARIAADQRGGVHIVYITGRLLDPGCSDPCTRWFYLERLPSGQWQEPVFLKDDNVSRIEVEAGPDGTVHFIWIERIDEDLMLYRSRSAQGTWGGQIELARGDHLGQGALQFTVDRTLHVHVLGGGAAYMLLSPSGIPILRETSFTAHREAFLAVDDRGVVSVVHYAYDDDDEVERAYFRQRLPDRGWTRAATIPSARPLALDASATPHMIWADQRGVHHLSSSVASRAHAGTISQVVELPSTLRHPTLAFMYELQGTDGGRSAFDVRVTDRLSETLVFSQTTDTLWSLASIDLERWAGQTVTVSFSLRQGAGAAFARLSVDDVSLGSRSTPLVTRVSPAEVAAGETRVVTITGANFGAATVVQVSDRVLTDVQWVDEQTLRVTLPADLPLGMHRIWVTNPHGLKSASRGVLRVGKAVFWPLVTR